MDAEGKAPTVPGETTGITLKLRNALLKFADRPGPTWVICQVLGGNLTAIDAVGDNMYPLAPSAFVSFDRTLSTSATITETEGGSGLSEEERGWLQRTLGLAGEFKRAHTIVRDGNRNIVSAIIDVYDNESDYEAETNRVARYEVTGEFAGKLVTAFGQKPI